MLTPCQFSMNSHSDEDWRHLRIPPGEHLAAITFHWIHVELMSNKLCCSGSLVFSLCSRRKPHFNCQTFKSWFWRTPLYQKKEKLFTLLPKQEIENTCTYKMKLFGNYLLSQVYNLMNIKMINKKLRRRIFRLKMLNRERWERFVLISSVFWLESK